ncbi:MAG: glycosyltransferase family 39 protein [Elusimicrobia bacterium]|nr:glycosyltransferase family 39 protein [Elusimicrobiota bacterium]
MGKYYKFIVPLAYLAVSLFLKTFSMDFPLNDDWAYSIAVRHLMEDGRIILSDWAPATQITHVLFGGLFAGLFGFHFGILRLSTILLFTCLLFVFQMILQEMDAKPKHSIAIAAVLAFNPLCFLLSHSFMNDIPYLFWMTVSAYFYVKYLRTENEKFIYLASLFSAFAYLTRQLGMALPPAFTLSLLLQKKMSFRNLLRIWLIPALAFLGHWLWFKYVHGPTWIVESYLMAKTAKHLLSPAGFLVSGMQRFADSLIETGFFLFPAALGFIPYIKELYGKNEFKARVSRFSMIVFLVLTAVYVFSKGYLPYLENNFTRHGLGVITVGASDLKNSGIFSRTWFWFIATGLGALCGSIFLSTTLFTIRARDKAINFLLYCALFHFMLSIAGARFFDRYIITFFIWFLASTAFLARRLNYSTALALAGLALSAGLALAGTKDYFAWNSVKWKISGMGAERGINREEVSAGFDYNAWFHYEKNMKLLKSIKPLKMISEWEWQKPELLKTKAFVSFRPVPAINKQGTAPEQETIASIEYKTPLSKKPGTLYLIKYH